MITVFDFIATTITGQQLDLAAYRGKVLLIVNTASECGFTPQYQALQALHQQFSGQPFAILAFPCNQFGHQEPGDNASIQQFCQKQFGIGFDLFAKIDVNGKDTHPLFRFLKHAAPGFCGWQSIKWNFTKFLVDADGKTVKRYAPFVSPTRLQADISQRLAALN
jgi:glutathione peroxidase